MINTQALYVFYEKNGEVRDFVLYYLSELKKIIPHILVIINGEITLEGKRKLENLGCEILIRENKGLDFGAWKAGIEYIGWEKIRQLEGLLLCNCTCYGPIYPLSEMFDAMNKKNCDFWGVNRHPEIETYFVPHNLDSKVIEHLQSYFLFFKPHLLRSNHFKKWWDDLVEYSDYNYEVGLHETKFTAYLENAGYKSAVYMDFEKYKQNKLNSSLMQPDEQHIKDRNPFVKRRIFFLNNRQRFETSIGHTAKETLDYIDKHTDYDVNLIWEDLIATQKMSILHNNLHLNYYLSTKDNDYKVKDKVALVLFVYYDDLVGYCVKYVKSMPKGCDLYIISAKEKLLQQYEKILTESGYNVICRKAENRGRDMSACLVTGADVYDKYDYICYMHDKKTSQLPYPLQGKEFAYHCFENNLASPGFVNNIIKTFNENPKLGMLVPPTIHFGPLYTLGNEQGVNKKNLKEVYQKLNLTIPFDEHPVAPFGTMFWVRGKAFKSIFNHKWQYSDFPLEPIAPDGTISHAIERVFPLAVQNDGYYIGWLATQYYANVYLDNLAFEVQQFGLLSKRNLFSIVKKGLKLQYWRYKLLSKITFGKMRKHYKTKKQEAKRMLKEI